MRLLCRPRRWYRLKRMGKHRLANKDRLFLLLCLRRQRRAVVARMLLVHSVAVSCAQKTFFELYDDNMECSQVKGSKTPTSFSALS